MCGQQSYQYNKVNRYCTSINFVDQVSNKIDTKISIQ